MDAALWGLIGVIVGGLITIGAETVRARNEARLDSAKRRDDRAIERDRFQLAKLESLQDAIDALGRVTSRISDARHEASARAGRWVMLSEYIEPELAEANRIAGLRVSSLSAVVLDDEVRAHCAKAANGAIRVAAADTREASEAAFVEFVTVIADASTHCGAVIREILTKSTAR